MEIVRPRYMGAASNPGYTDHWHAMMRARGTYGAPMPPDHWQILTDREAHALFTHTIYLRSCAELGYWSPDHEGIAFSVWEGCEPDDQASMAQQMVDGVAQKKAEDAARPQGWGDW